jgi:hypothetical protein
MNEFETICNWVGTFIDRVGFPIFVAVWVLIIQQKALNKLTGAINSLTRAVDGDRFLSKHRGEGGD